MEKADARGCRCPGLHTSHRFLIEACAKHDASSPGCGWLDQAGCGTEGSRAHVFVADKRVVLESFWVGLPYPSPSLAWGGGGARCFAEVASALMGNDKVGGDGGRRTHGGSRVGWDSSTTEMGAGRWVMQYVSTILYRHQALCLRRLSYSMYCALSDCPYITYTPTFSMDESRRSGARERKTLYTSIYQSHHF